jgi:hypothetical protein
VPKSKAPTFSWDNVPVVDQARILYLVGGDGHSIFDADALKAEGASAYVIDHFTTVEKSDGSYKGSIFSSETGELQKELRGVYGLTVTRSLARHYGVESHKFGRGSEARELTEKLTTALIAADDAAAAKLEGGA